MYQLALEIISFNVKFGGNAYMKDKSESGFFKTIEMMICLERETYLMYTDAANKASNPECKKILDSICKQTKDHMNKAIEIYTKLLVHRRVLDEETESLLLSTKKLLSDVKQDPVDLLKTCSRIERKMGDIYEDLSREKELEAWYEEQFGHDFPKKYLEEIVIILKQLSSEERLHEKQLNNELNKYVS